MAVTCRVWFWDGLSDDMPLVDKSLTETGKLFEFKYYSIRSCSVKEYLVTDTTTHRAIIMPQIGEIDLINGDVLDYHFEGDDEWGKNW